LRPGSAPRTEATQLLNPLEAAAPEAGAYRARAPHQGTGLSLGHPPAFGQLDLGALLEGQVHALAVHQILHRGAEHPDPVRGGRVPAGGEHVHSQREQRQRGPDRFVSFA
jgi:hypothetical protein